MGALQEIQNEGSFLVKYKIIFFHYSLLKNCFQHKITSCFTFKCFAILTPWGYNHYIMEGLLAGANLAETDEGGEGGGKLGGK